MSSITLSAGVRQSLTALQSAAAQSSVIQNRLATGKKVNSALDNPASFFTASGLNNRANDLSRLLDDMGQAVKTLQAADKGLTAISKLVENAQSIAKQAKAAPVDSAFVAAAATKLTGSSAGTIAGATTLDSLGFQDNDTITTTVEGVASANAYTFADATAATVTTLMADIDATDASNVTSSVVGGQLEITNSQGRKITISSNNETGLSGLMGAARTVAANSDTPASTKRAQLQADYDALMTQIDQLAKDSSYNGVNLLDGDDLSVQFNENNSSKLEITGQTISASGLSLSTVSLDTDANINDAVASLKAATDTLRAQAATFGSNLSVVQNRQDFTKGMVDTLTAGADLLVVADPNEEGANLLALNTRSQIAQTTLAMASQADSAVLRLF
jgi:flagellin-like hook-associated protein FlgL